MTENSSDSKPSGKYLAGLSLAALGIVYGDIGTSPLYAFRESFHEVYGLSTSPANVLGILSLIFWSLLLVISIKYMMFILRADLKGEGGILVLSALVTPKGKRSKMRNVLILLGLFGAALLYGDSTITPAITVLSSIEGLEVATTFFDPYIIPITIGILLALFYFQRFGTARIGKIFGSVMFFWFAALAVLGISQILQSPEVFRALNPGYALNFFARNGMTGFLVLGSVFLVVTGGEALYADIGHFGTKPIRLMWFSLVLPALLLNYFGQGALLLNHPEAVRNPFFLMAPNWALYPLVVLATAAAIIASQAVISGAFSLTRQAVQFGDLPRFNIVQTSTKEVGQIYVPAINWTLMFVTIGLVIGFGSSSNLAAAYGVAITMTMVITTILFADIMRRQWNWNLLVASLLTLGFLTFDLAFFGANIHKIPDGGWFPIVLTAIIFTLMTTWKKGRKILAKRLESTELPLENFMNDLGKHTDIEENTIKRVDGTAVYMYSNPKATPPALLHNIKHNKVIHKNLIILSVANTDEVPYISPDERLETEDLGNGFYRMIIHNGFAQNVNIPYLIKNQNEEKLNVDMQNVTFFLGKERILPSQKKTSEMAKWRDRLFGIMVRNEQPATTFFSLPPNRVVEIGAQVKM